MNWAHGVPPWKKVDERGCDIPYLGYARQKCFVTGKIECSGKKSILWGRICVVAKLGGVAGAMPPLRG